MVIYLIAGLISIVINICDTIISDYLVSSDGFCFYAGTQLNLIKPQNHAVNSEEN